MAEPRFSYIFAAELYERLLWFVRLRWLAVAGLAVASLFGPRLGLPAAWPSLFVVAAFVALYNSFLHRWLRARKGIGLPYANLRAIAITQMVADLAALMVTVHFTGGMQSPLLAFFAFHMAIGTIIISTRIMYVLAVMCSVGAFAVFLLETLGTLEVDVGIPAGGAFMAGGRNLLALIVAMFGIVYLTDSVTSRFKQRNIQLYRTMQKLSQRTEQLQHLLDEMEKLESRKSHYMRISAHQLRSPLATVKTSLEVLSGGYVDPASERGRKLLAGVVEPVNKLLAIVNDLLDLAKVREGRGKNAPWRRKVSLNQIFQDLFVSLAPFAEERRVELASDFEGEAVLEWGIAPDLLQAFENLLQNGIKYSHPGGTLTTRLSTVNRMVVVRVIDQGIGIPADSLEEVFLEFVRIPNAKRHSTEGTGLGLAIVREVVEAHGGRVSARSVEGEGSTFTVTLPMDHHPPEVERPYQEAASIGEPSAIPLTEMTEDG